MSELNVNINKTCFDIQMLFYFRDHTPMQNRGFIFGLMLCFSLLSLSLTAQQAQFPNYQIQQVASDLHFPWSLAFLPDGNLLVTERVGTLRIVSNGKVSEPITGVPTDIYVKGQGGLLEVVLHPDFANNHWLYLSYSIGTDNKKHRSSFDISGNLMRRRGFSFFSKRLIFIFLFC